MGFITLSEISLEGGGIIDGVIVLELCGCGVIFVYDRESIDP